MKPLNEQINPDFIRQVAKLAQYKQLLSAILPIECRNHVEIANIRDQNLILITDSPVWTTRLRQLSPQILDFIRKNNPNTEQSSIIHHIQISTRYHHSSAAGGQAPASANKKRALPLISHKTAELLFQSANSINHPQLKNALLKIAKHSNDKSNTEK